MRVAQKLRYMCAPHEPGQPHSHRVPSVAGSGFSDTPMHRGVLYVECIGPWHRQDPDGSGQAACATHG